MVIPFALSNVSCILWNHTLRKITNFSHWILLCSFIISSLPVSNASPIIAGQHFNVLRRFEISQKSCNGFDQHQPGVCMFNFQCHQRGGRVIGTCIDGFLFGACCSLSSEALDALVNEYDNSVGLTPTNELQLSKKNLAGEETNDVQSGSIDTVTSLPQLYTAQTTSSGKLHDSISESPSSLSEKQRGKTSTTVTMHMQVSSVNNATRNKDIFITNPPSIPISIDEISTTEKYVHSENESATTSSSTKDYHKNSSLQDDFALTIATPVGNQTATNDSIKIQSEIFHNEITTTKYENQYLGAGIEDKWIIVASSSNAGDSNQVSNGFVVTTISSDVKPPVNKRDPLVSALTNISNNEIVNSTSATNSNFDSLILENANVTISNNLQYEYDNNITINIAGNHSRVKDNTKFASFVDTKVTIDKPSLVTPPTQNVSSTTHLPATNVTHNILNQGNQSSTEILLLLNKNNTIASSSNVSSYSVSPTAELGAKPNVTELTTQRSSSISISVPSQLKSSLTSTMLPVSQITAASSTTEATTQEPLLFWTTRAPPTGRTQKPIALHNETDSSEIQELSNDETSIVPVGDLADYPSSLSESDDSYVILLQHIANNILHNKDFIWETSTESWGSLTYPVITKNLTNDSKNDSYFENPLITQTPIFTHSENEVATNESISEIFTQAITSSTSAKPSIELSSKLPASDNGSKIDTLPTKSEVKPPIDLNLLVQLLNLTSYIPDEDVFIPSPHLPIHEISNEIEEPNHTGTLMTTTTTTTQPLTITTTNQPTTTTTAIQPTTTTLTTTTTTSTTATTTRKKWNWKTTCGVRPLVREGRIVNGRRSDFGEWPWQALVRESTWLGIFTKNKCGGVLLNSKYVITAAHCQPGFLASLIVVLGELDVSDDYEPKKTVQKNVKRVVVHKDFVARTFDNDLALLELESPIEFDEHIVPICLPQGERNFVGSFGYVSGWGRLSYQGSIPNLLHNVEVPVIPNTECQVWFKEAGHSKTIKPEFICAGYKNGKKDSCEGDSGGPLSIREDDGRWVLAGIVSHGIKCAYPNLPGVYMRMSYYKPWIDKIINS